MRIGDYSRFCETALKAGKVFLAVGAPGVGKTVAKMSAAERLGWDYIGICTPLCDVAFLAGYPYRENGSASFAPFGQLARALKATRPTCLDFDEIGAASETVIKAALRLFQFREVGDKRLPDCVVLSASSNDVTHSTGILGFNEAMKDRFDTIVNIEANLEDTVQYGLANDWDIDVLAYLRNADSAEDGTSALHDWKPNRSMQCSGSTPRAWEKVSDWLKAGVDDEEVLAGKVGKGRANQFLAFRKLRAELPDVNECLLSPETAVVPKNPSAQYLVSMALAARIDGHTFGQAMKYLLRLPGMFRAFAIRDSYRAEAQRKASKKLPVGYKLISDSRDFAAWVCSEEGKEILSAVS